ncbi:MAG: hypothetical protein ACI4DT_10590 [Chordicoccus sp.]
MKATVRILDENGKAKALLEVSDSWKFIKEDTDNSSFVMMVDPETVTHLDVVDAVTPAWKLGDAGSSRDDRDTEDSLVRKEIKPEDIPASGAYEGFAGYHVTAVSGVGKNGPFRYPIVKFQTDFYDGDCLLVSEEVWLPDIPAAKQKLDTLAQGYVVSEFGGDPDVTWQNSYSLDVPRR